MRISELIGYKQHPAFQAAQQLGSDPGLNDKSYGKNEKKNLSTHLEKLGWTLIGHGQFSLVYANPKFDYVLKIFTQDTAGGIEWLEYVVANQKNPFLPRIYGKVWRISITAYAVRMERLMPFKSKTDPVFAKYIDPNIQSRSWEEIFDEGNEGFLKEHWPDLDAAFETILRLSQYNGDDDLNLSNIMKRGDSLVITDPVV
jgi:hypothetical protein